MACYSLASVSSCSGSLARGMVVVVEVDFDLVGHMWGWAIFHRPYLSFNVYRGYKRSTMILRIGVGESVAENRNSTCDF
jgi:hypothetical protein